jgi:hypothetical protein
MREHRNVITCTVATANGFAMPYRARPVPPLEKIPAPQNTKKESSLARVSKSHAAEAPTKARRHGARS